MDMLDLKHHVMTSPFAAVSKRVSALLQKPSEWANPELGELMREDASLFAILPKLVARDAHCLDVGAHIGSFAYRLAKLAPHGSLTMIEALPRKAEMLRKRFAGATVHEVAVGNAEGTVDFFENLDQSGFSSLANRVSRGRTEARQVRQCRIDTLIPDGQIDFIKIDVEGFELEALQGAQALIERCHPAIVFEAGATIDSDLDNAQGDDLFALLTATHGYQVWSVAGFQRGDAPLDLAAYRRCRTYPFQAFNFVALQPQATDGPNPNEVPQ